MGLLVEALLQDGLNGSVLRAFESKGSSTGGLEAIGPEAFGQGDEPLGGPEIVEHPVLEERLDELEAVGTDLRGLFETPLRVSHLVGDGIRGQVFIDGGSCPRLI